MLENALSIHFMLLMLALALWINFFEQKKLKFIFGLAAFVALFNYAIFLFASDHSLNFKFADLSLSLFLLAAVSLISQFTRKSIILKLLWLGALGGLLYHSISKNTLQMSGYTEQELDPKGEILADLTDRSGIPMDLIAIMEQYDLTSEVAFTPNDPDQTDLDDYIVIDIPKHKIDQIKSIYKALEQCNDVDWVELNEQYKLEPLVPAQIRTQRTSKAFANDPDLDKQWSYKKTGSARLYKILSEQSIQIQKRARLFILDTGVDGNHEDLRSSYISVDPKSDQDKRGHGTHCAGIAGAVTNNNIGIASVAPNPSYYSISGIKVLSDSGIGFQKNIIQGIITAVDASADVISMSLGGKTNQMRQKAYDDAIAYANNKNTIVVVAAGNSNDNAIFYCPANSAGVITVSAVDENLNKANFSNTVQEIQYGIAAPGVGIHSTFPQNKYMSFNGTSMAAPHVAGLIALMKSISPSLSTQEVFEILDGTGIPTTSKVLTGNFIQADQAIETLINK